MSDPQSSEALRKHAEGLVRWLGIPAFAASIWLLLCCVILLLMGFTIGLAKVVYILLTIVMSGVEFVAYWRDKRAARNDAQRTPERRLLAYAAIGGWPGALIAARLLHHKSHKVSYRWKLWLIVAVHVVVVAIVLIHGLRA